MLRSSSCVLQPDWWVRRIRYLFGDDGLPVYLVSDSPALAAKVVSALRRGKPAINAVTRVSRSERVVRFDQGTGNPPWTDDGDGVLQGGTVDALRLGGGRLCNDVYTQLADVEMLVRAQKLAAVIGEGMVLSNLPKLAIKLRSGRQTAVTAASSVRLNGGSDGLRVAVKALSSVFNVDQYEGPSAPRSVFDDCDLSSARMSNATANCHLDALIGLDYYGAVG